MSNHRGPNIEKIIREFNLARFQFIFEAKNLISFPHFPGSALRGAFGRSFKEIACQMRQSNCDNCPIEKRCIYRAIFHPSLPDGIQMKRMQTPPPPYIFSWEGDNWENISAGDKFHFHLVLIGRFISAIPYIILAFKNLETTGIGIRRGKFKLKQVIKQCPSGETESVYSDQSNRINPSENKFSTLNYLKLSQEIKKAKLSNIKGKESFSLGIKFLTPTRIKSKDSLKSHFLFPSFWKRLLGRFNILKIAYCGGENLNPDLFPPYDKIILENKYLHWVDWKRFSKRQMHRMNLGGFIGSFRIRGNLLPFLPVLELGQLFHVGKNASFGAGNYRIEKN